MNLFNKVTSRPGGGHRSGPGPRPGPDPTPATRAESRLQTRHAVLDAARTEFERVGFERSGVRDIARQAGVSPGTVLHHFGSKRELLYAAFFDDLERAMENAVAAADAARSEVLEVRLEALAKSIFGSYASRPRLSRVFLRESLLAEPPWDVRFQGQVAALHGAVAGIGAAAMERGELRPDTDLALLGLAWVSFYTFALLAWVQGAPGVSGDPVGVIGRQVAQHLEGLRAAPPSGGAP